MSGSKVVLLVLAVGLISLFNGKTGGCADAKPSTSLKVENSAVPIDYYKSLYDQLELILKTDTHGAKAIEDQNTVQESESSGFLNMGSKVDYSDNHHDENGASDKGPGAFSAGTHNTFQSSKSNMTTNMGSWVTYGKNIYNGGSS